MSTPQAVAPPPPPGPRMRHVPLGGSACLSCPCTLAFTSTVYQTTLPTELLRAPGIVNRPVNKEWVSLRSLSPDQQRGATNVSSRHIARTGAASIGCAVAFTGLMQTITSSDFPA